MKRFEDMSFEEIRSHVQIAVEEDFIKMHSMNHENHHSHSESKKSEQSFMSRLFRKRS